MQFISAYQTYFLSDRCLANSKDLDNPVACKNPCTLKHAKLLVENMELVDVWKEYGLVGDVIVSYSST